MAETTSSPTKITRPRVQSRDFRMRLGRPNSSSRVPSLLVPHQQPPIGKCRPHCLCFSLCSAGVLRDCMKWPFHHQFVRRRSLQSWRGTVKSTSTFIRNHLIPSYGPILPVTNDNGQMPSRGRGGTRNILRTSSAGFARC